LYGTYSSIDLLTGSFGVSVAASLAARGILNRMSCVCRFFILPYTSHVRSIHNSTAVKLRFCGTTYRQKAADREENSEDLQNAK
jgi:hypothetical protein